MDLRGICNRRDAEIALAFAFRLGLVAEKRRRAEGG